MSWYKEQVEIIACELSAKKPTQPMHHKIQFNRLTKETPITLTINNLNTPADGEKLIQAFQEMEGIISVQPKIHQKKLTIFYNPDLISLNSITYTIAALGYHYIQRG